MRSWTACGQRGVVIVAMAVVVGSCAPLGARRARLTPQHRARCLGILRKGMRSDEFWPSIHAAEGLTLGGQGAEVRAFLEPKLKTETDDQRRCGIARELVRAGDRAKTAVMLEILAKKDAYGHVHAAESLYKVGGIGDGKLLRAAMSQTENASLQLMAAAALGRAGDKAAMRLLRARLTDPDPKVSRIAAWIIGRIGDASDIPQLRRSVAGTQDSFVRCYFEHALAALGDEQGRRALLSNLRSDDPRIRTYAATFAGDARMAEAAADLVLLLDDAHLDARLRAAQSLLVLARPAGGASPPKAAQTR